MSDIIYRPEGNGDASQDGPEREDSDLDEELEFDFETSVSDEGHDFDSNVLHGSLNFRIHMRGDSATETGRPNGASGLPTPSCQSNKVPYQVLILLFTS